MYSVEDEAILQYTAGYKVNLIAPEQMSEEEIGRFHSSLKEVLLYIKYSKDKQELRRIMQEDPDFHSLDRQAAEVINVTTNSRLKYPEGKERVDMCLVIEEMIADSEARGEAP